MATVVTNNSATALGLWDTSTAHHVVAGLCGAAVLTPDAPSQAAIDVLTSSGSVVTSTAAGVENTAAPVASGDVAVDETLSCTTGTWTGNPAPTYTYQWQVSDNGTTGWADVAGEASDSYTIVAGDLTKHLRCVVTATNAVGSDTANSNALGPVVAGGV